LTLNFLIAGCDRYTATIAARACANVVGSTGSERIVAGSAGAAVDFAPESLVVELPHAATEIAAIRQPTANDSLSIRDNFTIRDTFRSPLGQWCPDCFADTRSGGCPPDRPSMHAKGLSCPPFLLRAGTLSRPFSVVKRPNSRLNMPVNGFINRS
jgi:hypothetical protein